MYFKYHKQMDVRKILYKNTLYNENGIFTISVPMCNEPGFFLTVFISDTSYTYARARELINVSINMIKM